MIVTCVYVTVKAESIKKFIDATVENHLETVKEHGNLRFDFVQQADDPCRFMLYEAFENEESAAGHKLTAHYLRWRDEVKDLMDEPRRGVKYLIIEPSDKTKW